RTVSPASSPTPPSTSSTTSPPPSSASERAKSAAASACRSVVPDEAASRLSRNISRHMADTPGPMIAGGPRGGPTASAGIAPSSGAAEDELTEVPGVEPLEPGRERPPADPDGPVGLGLVHPPRGLGGGVLVDHHQVEADPLARDEAGRSVGVAVERLDRP